MTPRLEPAPLLSLVIPMHDEAESLEALLLELDPVLSRLAAVGVPSETLLVDDASRDRSVAVALELACKLPGLRVLALSRREGQSGALAAGFRAARGDVIVTLDADLQNDPSDIPRLLRALDDGYDCVNGVRVERHDGGWRRFTSRVANAVRNRATGVTVTDVGCSLRAMRSPFVRRLKLYRGLHRFLPTLLALEGARLVEVPVGHRSRRFGRSNYGTLGRLAAGSVDLWAVVWMQRRALRARARELTPGAS